LGAKAQPLEARGSGGRNTSTGKFFNKNNACLDQNSYSTAITHLPVLKAFRNQYKRTKQDK